MQMTCRTAIIAWIIIHAIAIIIPSLELLWHKVTLNLRKQDDIKSSADLEKIVLIDSRIPVLKNRLIWVLIFEFVDFLLVYFAGMFEMWNK